MAKQGKTSWSAGILRALGLSKRRKGIKPNRRRSFGPETLESRTLLSICTWVGGGTTGHWSDAANWRVSGGSNTTPQAGDELVFAGAAQTATDNDLAAGTAFHSIEVEAAGFSIAGHAIALPNGADLALTTGSANISANVILGGELHAVGESELHLDHVGRVVREHAACRGAQRQPWWHAWFLAGPAPTAGSRPYTAARSNWAPMPNRPCSPRRRHPRRQDPLRLRLRRPGRQGPRRHARDRDPDRLGTRSMTRIRPPTATGGRSASNDPAAHQVTATYAVPGDANLDGTVNVADLTTVLTNFGQSGKTWLQGDFDGDGKVTVEDLTVVLANFNVSAPQVTVNFGVTSSGIANVTANAGLVSSAVDLWPAFADVAGPSSDLTYKVTDDTNPSLFSSLQIDPASGRMTLAYAPQVLGSSRIDGPRHGQRGGIRRGDVLGHGGRPGRGSSIGRAVPRRGISIRSIGTRRPMGAAAHRGGFRATLRFSVRREGVA